MDTANLRKNNNRDAWIDYIKGMCMIVIILNHISLNPVYGQYTYSWELPGFFFVGGYTFGLYNGFRTFIVKKFRSLVVPVFAFGLLNLLLSCVAKDISVIDRLKGIFFQIPGHDDDMWFVACLFVMEFIFYFLVRFIKNDCIRFLMCLLLLCAGLLWKDMIGIPLPWHIVNACMMLIFVEIGYLAKKRNAISLIKGFINKPSGLMVTVMVVCLYIFLARIIDNYPVDTHLLNYGNTALFYVLAVSGMAAILILSLLMEKCKESFFCRSVAYIGRNSLAYYGLQSKVITAIVMAGFIIGLSPRSIIVPPIYTVIALIVLAFLSYLVKRYMPFMLGKTYKK